MAFVTKIPKPKIPLLLMEGSFVAASLYSGTSRGVLQADWSPTIARKFLHATNEYEGQAFTAEPVAPTTVDSPNNNVNFINLISFGIIMDNNALSERYADLTFATDQGIYLTLDNTTNSTSCVCDVSSLSAISFDGKSTTVAYTFELSSGTPPNTVMVPGHTIDIYVGNGL